jgi:hypothetical protein
LRIEKYGEIPAYLAVPGAQELVPRTADHDPVAFLHWEAE